MEHSSDMRISDFLGVAPIHTRIRNAITMEYGNITIAELLCKKRVEILGLHNFGKKCFYELVKELSAHGYNLASWEKISNNGADIKVICTLLNCPENHTIKAVADLLMENAKLKAKLQDIQNG